MRCYYARAISLYRTPQSARDVITLKALGFDVVDPDTPEHSAGYDKMGMDYFVELVQTCNALAFRATPDGRIPAGVAKEIRTAQACAKLVFELPSGIERRAMSVAETREYLRDIGHR